MTLNKKITDYGYVTYLALLSLIRKDQKLYYINPNYIAYVLTDKYPPSRTMFSLIYDGIVNLVNDDVGILKIEPAIDSNKKKYEWIADLSSISEKDGFYTTVDFDDIKVILNKTSHFGNAVSLVRFYIYLLSTIHKKKDETDGVGFTSIDDMVKVIDIDQKTIYSYLTKLESLQLIYVYRSKCSVIKEDGTVKEIPATYGKFKEMEKIIQAGKEHENKINSKVSRINKNNTRSLSQKYNFILDCIKQGKEVTYDPEECLLIHEELQDLNNRYIEQSKKDRIKDLSIFAKYNLFEKKRKENS